MSMSYGLSIASYIQFGENNHEKLKVWELKVFQLYCKFCFWSFTVAVKT